MTDNTKDLGFVLSFNDEDLAANRAGNLSKRQLTGQNGMSLFKVGFMALFSYMGLNFANYLAPLNVLLGLVTGAVVIGIVVAYYLYNRRSARNGVVLSTNGTLQYVNEADKHGIKVGEHTFDVTKRLQEKFNEGDKYTIYFVENETKTIVSAEPFTD